MSIVEGIEKYIPYITTKDKKHQQVSYQTQSNTVIVNDDGLTLDDKLKQIDGITLIGTLIAGQTEIVFEDEAITTDSTIDYYVDIYGISAKDVSVENGKLTMIFKVLENNLKVKVVVKNAVL